MNHRQHTETHRTHGPRCHRTARSRVRVLRGAHPAEWCAAIIIILLLAVAVVLWAQSPAVGTEASMSLKVAAGDTLWSIASENRLPGRSTAETADAIRALNEMQSCSLAIGERLLIPVVPGGTEFVAAR